LAQINNYGLANRYCEAILNIGKEEDILDEIFNNIISIKSIFEMNSNKLFEFINNNSINQTSKKNVLVNLFSKEDYLPYVIHLCFLLIDNQREFLFFDLFNVFIERYSKIKKILEVHVDSPIKLNDEQKQNISKYLSKKTNMQIKLIENIDETIIGGLVIRYNDKIIDSSVIRNFEVLEKTFLT